MNYFSKSWPYHIKDAVENKNYVEAFLCLHMFLESDLIGCMFMDIFDEKFFQRLMEFNSSRNKLAHQLLKKNLDEDEIKKEIEKGMKIYDEVEEIMLKLQEKK